MEEIAPKKIVLLRCPDCGGKRTVKPGNTLYATGGLECPHCSTIYQGLAKYERVEKSDGTDE